MAQCCKMNIPKTISDQDYQILELPNLAMIVLCNHDNTKLKTKLEHFDSCRRG